jgi:hypothetical protein
MIRLPYLSPPLTYNQMMGKHWSMVHQAKTHLLEAGFYLSRARHAVMSAHQYAGAVDLDLSPGHRESLPRPFLSAVTVELIYWPGNNTVHDADNMAPTLKYIVDGLRKSGVLKDDRGRYVRSATCTVIELNADPDGRTDPRMALVVREV